MEKLSNTLHNNTKLPSDIISIITEYTLCNCVTSKLIVIQQTTCYYCNEPVSTIIKNINKVICRKCRHMVYFSQKNCKICHDCIIENHRNPVQCLDCENIFYKTTPLYEERVPKLLGRIDFDEYIC